MQVSRQRNSQRDRQVALERVEEAAGPGSSGLRPATRRRSSVSLRQTLRARRRALPEADQARHALLVCRHLFRSALVLHGRISAYAAFDGELDLWPFIARHPRIALPVIASPTRMTFRPFRMGDPVRRNRFGIVEPLPGRPVGPLALAAVLTPLVGFSEDGGRLGMGAGYYDRRFAARERPAMIGVAHELQRVDTLPVREWDVPLDAVVTERGWRYFTARGRSMRLSLPGPLRASGSDRLL